MIGWSRTMMQGRQSVGGVPLLLVVIARFAHAIAFNLADVDSAQAIGFRREDVAAVND
jgi:hypothetical protein